MKLHPLSNGRHYGWSALRSVFDFFFPYKKWHDETYWKWNWNKGRFEEWRTGIIRAEMAVQWNCVQGVTGEDFYTFRAFVMHNLYKIWNRVKILKYIEIAVEQMVLAPGIVVPAGIHFAIAFDATAKTSGTGTSVSYAHTITGSNTWAVIDFYNDSLNGARTFSVPKFNGVATTQVGVTNQTGVNGQIDVEHIIGPTTGNVTATQSTSGYFGACSVSYSGVKQTSPVSGTVTQNTGTASTESIALTVPTNGWAIAVNSEGKNGTPTAGANTTDRAGAVAQCNGSIYDSNAIASPSWTLNFSSVGSTWGWADIGFAISPVAAVVVAMEWAQPTSQPTSHWNQSNVSV
jgi:hypothetical protein